VLLESLIDSGNVGLVDVVPTALMVADGKRGRQLLTTSQVTILSCNINGARTREQEELESTRFTEPVCLNTRWEGWVTTLALAKDPVKHSTTGGSSGGVRLGDIDPSLGGVQPKETSRLLRTVSNHEWNGTIQGHLRIKLILENIQVVETVGITRNAISPEI
jgi:hypothetical protein